MLLVYWIFPTAEELGFLSGHHIFISQMEVYGEKRRYIRARTTKGISQEKENK
jgi:hypothetical protein